MPPSPSPGAAAFSRRRLLAAAGILALAAGCTSTQPKRPQVSAKQADELAKQVTVQESLVAAFATATSADPAVGAQVADLADQARQQLDKLKAAAPTASSAGPASGSAASGSAPSVPPAPPPGTDLRAWLRQQVAAAASSHADAALDQTGARAALLGSISAGLRGQDSRLA